MKPASRKLGMISIAFLLAAGCSSVKPPAGRDAFNDYVPHREILAPAGSADNPDTGWNSLLASVQQMALPPK